METTIYQLWCIFCGVPNNEKTNYKTDKNTTLKHDNMYKMMFEN